MTTKGGEVMGGINMARLNRMLCLSVLIFCLLTALGCATAPFEPGSIDEVGFVERAETKGDEDVRVSVSVLSAEESKQLFGVDLAEKGIQPVWIKVENRDDEPYWLMSSGLDPEYFSPLEAAYVNYSGFSDAARNQMNDYFNDMKFPEPVYPHVTASGFVYVNLDERIKIVKVDLFSPGEVKSFTFIVRVPGFKADMDKVDFERLYREEDIVHIDDLKDFRQELERLPSCTTNEDGTKKGDPLNLIFIGTREDIGAAFVRRGWHPTERIHPGSMQRTVSSFLSGSRYRYSPVSPLYVYGRQQDVAIQRSRSSIHMRNHLRFWLSPMRFRDKPVWVGQISRDIGVIFAPKSWTLTTHKIDSDVDEARNGLIGDLAYSQGVVKFGFVTGVGQALRSEPRRNLMDDTYYTDGLRAVLWFEHRPRSLADLEFIDWERPREAELLETK
jgi:hypothetical protein